MDRASRHAENVRTHAVTILIIRRMYFRIALPFLGCDEQQSSAHECQQNGGGDLASGGHSDLQIPPTILDTAGGAIVYCRGLSSASFRYPRVPSTMQSNAYPY